VWWDPWDGGNDDRIKMLFTLVSLPSPPEPIPINKLMRIPRTHLENSPEVDPVDFIRTIFAKMGTQKEKLKEAAGKVAMHQ